MAFTKWLVNKDRGKKIKTDYFPVLMTIFFNTHTHTKKQVCHECAEYKHGEVCEDECPQDYYADE